MNKVITQIDSRGVAQVILNNPDKHNAFDDQMIIELTNAFECPREPTAERTHHVAKIRGEKLLSRCGPRNG